MSVWNGFGSGVVVALGTGDKAHFERPWTSRRHDEGDGTKSFQAFGFCMWDCVLGAGNGEGNTLVAPLWRRRCEREIYAPMAPLRRGRRERVTGWAWTGGALMPRRHLDQDHHRQNGHSRLRASRLATGHGSQPPLGIKAGPQKRYCRPARPSAEPSRPNRLARRPAHRVLHGGEGCETG